MDRKDFLKIISTSAIGTTFSLNGFATTVMNQFLDLPISCNEVNDRVLVIIRLAGANDGLNMIIPISQYATYANLRPNIKINQTGNNAYIPLDTTLSSNKLTGLHPNMIGLKNLYDSGKVTLISGVGYTSPNYSHFKSENTMFAGKDGTNNNDTVDGMFGRFLGDLYPGLPGRPTLANPDPLAIQLGNANPCLFYGHTHENSIEYNITGFQNTLFSSLQRTLPIQSEYNDLQEYIKSIELGMDSYYNRVQTVFNNGFNSGVSYPNSSLGKQLKTVARMIKGGSKTKIFQVNVVGFDTHVNQVQSGNSHLGTHANLMTDISNSVSSFQNDIQNLGFSDKVMTVSFSEFGRNVRENGNLGTDHGDLSSFFVIGNAAQAGVLNDHPVFTNTTSYFYDQNQLRTDYRSIFKTLMQDWLGASNQVITNAGLNDFSKVSLISNLKNAATGGCLTNSIVNCEDTIALVPLITDNNWTYYGLANTTNYLFAIEHTPAGGNVENFTAQINLKKKCNVTNNTHKVANTITKEGLFIAGYYWNIIVNSGAINGYVHLRFFPDTAVNTDLESESDSFYIATSAQNLSPAIYFKTNNVLNLPDDIRSDAKGLNYGFLPLVVNATGTYSSKNYVQFNQVNNLNNSGGGLLKRVTNLDQNSFLTPSQAEQLKGNLRYNRTNDKFEGFNGSTWIPLH